MMTGIDCGSSCDNVVTVATCNLNQWALDFDGNLERIYESCVIAKEELGAQYRLGPELEVSGYGCEDHFFEQDTFAHCWESLIALLERGATDGMVCDFGMPVLFGGIRYNCRVICKDRKVLLIRPKTSMADSGNYRESRYFTPYIVRGNGDANQEFLLPTTFRDKFEQVSAPFGTHYIQFGDGITLGCESCEELWTPDATNIQLALQGVEIIGNGSGSHHELRKLDTRLDLIVNATRKCGGVYLYANQRGCDGGRLYFDGGALIVCNGQILAKGQQFAIDKDVEVISAKIDLDDVRSYRASIASFGMQQITTTQKHPFVNFRDDFINKNTNNNNHSNSLVVLPQQNNNYKFNIHCPEEECCLGPACWLWDYLRRSGASGFFLPLSGGADSSSVATIVGVMCHMVTNAMREDPNGLVAKDCRRICRIENDDSNKPVWVPNNPQEVANYILHTAYMGTTNSSQKTLSRAKRLSDAIGSYHLSITIDLMVEAVVKVFTLTTSFTPKFTINGGSMTEDLALQNIQARLRMITAYLFAQLLPWVRGRGGGFLLVLGSANVDEGLRGYMTKYDCSSADLNPIGAISKGDLKRMLLWASKNYDGYEDVLAEIAGAPPTAELRPIHNDKNAAASGGEEEEEEEEDGQNEHSQLDEEEMGMTYEELGFYGTLRKISRCGPVTMFRKLCIIWNHLSAETVAAKVKRFFFYYSINRHKMCTITPAYHAEGYSPDDNRFDLRPFLYNAKWNRQFRMIDELVAKQQQQQQQQQTPATTATKE